MAKSALRNLVFPENPFALGSSPDRIAPVHILNGFVAACKGYTDLGDIIPALVAAQKPPIEKFPSLLGSQILSKNVRVQRLFQDDLKVIVGPDRRIWPTFGSPIPIVASLAGNDASDSRFGPILWEMLSRGRTERDELEDELEQLLSPSENEISDPITALAEVLSTGATPKGRRGVGISPKAWFAEEGTKSGHVLADSLTEFLENLLRTDNSGGRLLRLRAFGRGLYLVTILSLILGPITAASSADVESVEDIGLLFVWGGTPPGTAQDAVIVSAARSLQTILDKSRRALVESLYNALQDHPVPSQLPASQRRRSVLERQLRLAGLNAAQATKHLDTLRTKAGIEVDGDTIPDLEWCYGLIDSVFPIRDFTAGIRTMGRKLGFIGPDVGSGVPRFLCETPLLGTIVAGICIDRNMSFVEFVDRARQQLGIVFGSGSDPGVVSRLGLWEGKGMGLEILRRNQEELRRRLIRSGLAREYSDGHTEVFIHVS